MTTTAASPWEGYDDQSATAVVAKLHEQPDLAQLVLAYERDNKDRVTVTQAAERVAGESAASEPTYEVKRILSDRRILAGLRPEVVAGALADAELADEDTVTLGEVEAMVEKFLQRPVDTEEPTDEPTETDEPTDDEKDD